VIEGGAGSTPVPKLSVISADEGKPVQEFNAPSNVNGVRWSPDQKGIQFVQTRKGASNIWEQSLSGGDPHPVTNFTSGRIYSFAWTHDGKTLLLARGNTVSDVVLISNFQ
jgi:Tol biopolymer transport system component